MTKKERAVARIETGVRNFDDLCNGGLPKGAVIVVAGPPGAGKTIFTQQICFHNASAKHRVLYFNTLSEPTAKTLRYLNQFSFFAPKKLDDSIQFVDLGVILRTKGLGDASKLIMEQIKKVKPAIVVIDSFKVFDDLAKSGEELRKFDYELAVNLMAWEITGVLLGEYGERDIGTNPLFSIIDGLVVIHQREQSGEQQRFIQIVKMRGTEHSRDEHSFLITANGVEVFAPRVTIKREDRGPGKARCKTGIARLDDLLGEGISRGSSLLIAGVAGTGKTVLLLEFLYRGALAGEKGIIFSFEETAERLRATAKGFGWHLEREIERGMVEIVFIPQPEIQIEKHLLMMRERVEARGAQRVAVDSVSVFLHKVKDPQIVREKIFQLASVIQNTQAVGFFATDIPYGTNQLSRFGVEETVVDGIILLSATEEGFTRERYLEVYKLRNTAHLKGRHNMNVGPGGITIFPRYGTEAEIQAPPPVEPSRRIPWGVPGLDDLCGGGLLERSITLVSGSAGVGKSTLAIQFVMEGAARNEPGIYVTLEEGPVQIRATAQVLGIPLEQAIEQGLVELVYLPREQVHASQLRAILEERIRSQKTRRLVIDSINQMARPGTPFDEVRQLLQALVAPFKAEGVTSLLTLEADSMFSLDTVTERGYSPLADNILMLRYAQVAGDLRPTLSVVKTRGSAHDRGTHFLSIGKGGVRIEELVNGARAAAKKGSRIGKGSKK